VFEAVPELCENVEASFSSSSRSPTSSSLSSPHRNGAVQQLIQIGSDLLEKASQDKVNLVREGIEKMVRKSSLLQQLKAGKL
jgi:hypothetical protein